MKKLERCGAGYRTVGLSATPGNCLEKIQEVITSLKAEKLQSKTDSDPDVKQYIHTKQIVEIQIQANAMMIEALRLLDSFLLKPINILIGMGVIGGFLVNTIKRQGMTQGTYFQILSGFQKNKQYYQQSLPKREYNMVYACLKIIRLMVDCKKALGEQGYDSFRQFMIGFKDNNNEKYKSVPFRKEILQSKEFRQLEVIFDKEQSANSHPKLVKLKELLVEFFSDKQNLKEQSKAIVFTGYKASALEIKNYLDLIEQVRPALFVGQSKMIATTSQLVEDEQSNISITSSTSIVQLNQKQQIATIRKFRDYEYNTLISTSIGEEGLDIGEVDLIICYDSGMSPIRMIQRMGRTGRKRSGKVYMLLMEGKEASKYEKATKESKSLQRSIRNNSQDSGAASNRSKQNKLTFPKQSSSLLPQEIQLAVEYLDNIIVKKQQSPIKKPPRSEVKEEQEVDSDHKPTLSDTEQTKQVEKPPSRQGSQDSDDIIDKLDALQNDLSLFESL